MQSRAASISGDHLIAPNHGDRTQMPGCKAHIRIGIIGDPGIDTRHHPQARLMDQTCKQRFPSTVTASGQCDGKIERKCSEEASFSFPPKRRRPDNCPAFFGHLVALAIIQPDTSANDLAHDFRCPRVDPADPGIDEMTRNLVFLHIARAAMQLQAGIHDLAFGF